MVASDVQVSILIANDIGFLVKYLTWKDFYSIPGATDLIEDLFPLLVYLTDYFSKILSFHYTRVLNLILYHWGRAEDKSAFKAFPFLMYALSGYSFRVQQQDFKFMCNPNTHMGL